MKSILMSFKPQTVARMLNGEQTILIAKSTPKETPFKVYVYETLGKVKGKEKYPAPWNNDEPTWFYWHEGRGKVVAEFVCDKVSVLDGADAETEKRACLTMGELFAYAKGKSLYALHISDLKVYDKPKELGEFGVVCKDFSRCENIACYKDTCRNGYIPITRPPQSWQYVDGEK